MFHIGRSILPTYRYNPLCLAEKCCKATSVLSPIWGGDRKTNPLESKLGTLGVDVRKSTKLNYLFFVVKI